MRSRLVDARSVHAGVVSIVIDARSDVAAGKACVDALHLLDWPDVDREILVIAKDDADRDAFRGLGVRLHKEKAGGAGAAWNLGAEASRGEWLAFLDTRARPEPGWIRTAVTAFRMNSRLAAVGCTVVDEHGRTSSGRSAVSLVGEPSVVPQLPRLNQGTAEDIDTLFPSEQAFFVDTKALRWIGGFDTNLDSGVEHVDLGWRLWISGFRARLLGGSIVRLVGEAQPATPNPATMLGMALKNLETPGDEVVKALMAECAVAQPELRESLEIGLFRARAARRLSQARRRVRDFELGALLQPPPAGSPFSEAFSRTVARCRSYGVLSDRRRILVLTPDVLRRQMAGPAIRAQAIACELAESHDVVLASTGACEVVVPGVEARYVDDASLRREVDAAEIVVTQGSLSDAHPWILDTDRILVVDLYDPIQLEALEQSRDLSPAHRRLACAHTVRAVNAQLARGDYFLCASEKQRHFWLGALAAAGRINPATYDGDESAASILSVAPFGMPEGRPETTRRVLRDIVPGIGDQDRIVLWGGGVYNWFDALTPIRAVDRLRHRLPNVRLFFMGMTHPNPGVPSMIMAERARELARSLGIDGTHVFFNESWVDYEDRQNYLLEADLGITTHFKNLETEFSFRTRVLDYLWASLPVVSTEGDTLADLIETRGLGVTVPACDERALEQALFDLLTRPADLAAARAAIEEVRPALQWPRALRPLVEFCHAPRSAPDRADPRQAAARGERGPDAMWGFGRRQIARTALAHARRGDVSEFAWRIRPRPPRARRRPADG
jgi:glycosyltransferase involved in cell wall biosynthesis